MNFLFDENLSRRLCGNLEDCFPNSHHVSEIGLENADDQKIWNFAKKEDMIIVSKDGDFHDLSFLFGAPPKVIWLRIGNCTTRLAESILRKNRITIQYFANDREAAILVLEN